MAKKTTRKTAAAKSAPRKPRSLKGKIQAMLAAKDAGRRQYQKAAAINAELCRLMKPGEEIDLGNGQIAVMVDRFADTNRVTAVTYASRLEIEIRHV